jgi:tRNA and rRNA cytosine-C5-methylases
MRGQRLSGIELIYDEHVMNELREVYKTCLNSFLESLRRPNSRLYFRLNTVKGDERIAYSLGLNRDEDLEEAFYTNISGPNKLELLDSRIIVDKRTAESAMVGSNVYRPGVKRIQAKGKEVSVISENGVHVANGVYNPYSSLVVNVTESLYKTIKVSELKEVKEGYIISQGKASMYVARFVEPAPGELIVDMNAFPGGKLSHVYQLEPRARVIGFDHTEKKVSRLREYLRLLGIKAEVFPGDSRYLYEDFGIKDVDKVIIDPPCSALGVRPKVYDQKRREDLFIFKSYQKQFLNSAYKILKKGGTVVYSTCTVTISENEEVVNDPRFELERIVRFHPNLHDLTGFFIAVLRKR